MTALRPFSCVTLLAAAATFSFGISVASAQTCPLAPHALIPSVCRSEASLCSVSRASSADGESVRTFTRTGVNIHILDADGKLEAACTFDDAQRLVRFEATAAPDLRFSYDEAGRLTRVDVDHQGDGVSSESCLYSYGSSSEHGDLVAAHDHLGDGVATHRVFYHYDAEGRLEATTRDHRVDGTIDGPRYLFVYAHDQLVREGTERYQTAFGYDARGNRTTVEHVVAGKITGQELSTYDAAGRLSSVRTSKSGRLQQLESLNYDGAGRLQSVVLTSGSGALIERSEHLYGCGPGEQLSRLEPTQSARTM